MKKLLLVAAVASVALAGCSGSNTPQQLKTSFPLDKIRGLEDCTFNRVDPGDVYSVITVVRCPNSTTSTTYQMGKTTATVVVIDGIEYVKKQ